jgi:signal transduction histidine kinase
VSNFSPICCHSNVKHMVLVLVFATIFLTLVWQLLNIHTNRQNHHQLMMASKQLQNYALLQEKNHNLVDFHNTLGQSIAALHIQLQVAQKLWQVNPKEAQQSLCEAYQLSGIVMHDVREIVKEFNQDST